MRALREAIGFSLLSVTVVLSTVSVLAQDGLPRRFCGTQGMSSAARPLDQTGGIYLPSTGVLRVLVVFASFPDDTTPHPYWPAHNPPLFMTQFIDPDTTTHSQGPFNLTNYFSQMSLGQFHFVGDVIWVESAHSQEEYRNGSYGRANWSLLQETVDPLVDFSQYDHWTRDAVYEHRNVPDGLVDMIIVVWRTTMWRVLGEASLGYKPGFTLDGKRIEMGFPEYVPDPEGSGVTCEYPYDDSPRRVMQTMVHEVSHWLLGGLHPYNGTTLWGKHAYWGMLCNGERVASCANAYERERLGWITVPEIEPGQETALTDFVPTGVARKYHPLNAEPLEYYYIENHQLSTAFDDVTANSDDKGMWILQQQGPYVELDNLRIVPSDGYWHWDNPSLTSQCFSQLLPVFKRGEPGIATGVSHRDQIPDQASATNWMYVYEDPEGQVRCGSFLRGEYFVGAFGRDVSPVFSAYSNPRSTTWDGQPTSLTLETVSETAGAVTVRFDSLALDAPPARRYLGRGPANPDTVPGRLSLAWGAQWQEGQPLEPDVHWSELQCQVGNNGAWSTVYSGPGMSWRDESNVYDTSGTLPVRFRARVRDAQDNYSAWSNILSARMVVANGLAAEAESEHESGLGRNYPNPFNPTTEVGFRIGNAGWVSIKVYDLLGREVATLVNEVKQPGTYNVQWNAAGLASGVYFCRLQTGTLTQTRKLLLLR